MTAPDHAGVVADGDVEHPLGCGRCDVAWRGRSGDACWVCGFPGVPRGEVRIVEDEPAA